MPLPPHQSDPHRLAQQHPRPRTCSGTRLGSSHTGSTHGTVRPFACGLLKGLRFLASQGALSIKHADAVKHFGELSIWQSRCFVRATGGAVRAWVSKALRRIGCAISHLAHFRPRSAKMIVRSCPLILTLAANASTRLLLLLTVLTVMPTLLRVVQARTTSSSL